MGQTIQLKDHAFNTPLYPITKAENVKLNNERDLVDEIESINGKIESIIQGESELEKYATTEYVDNNLANKADVGHIHQMQDIEGIEELEAQFDNMFEEYTQEQISVDFPNASTISIVDNDDLFTATTIEGALRELANNSGSGNAEGIKFDNSSNEMTSVNVQDAIEENKTSILNIENELSKSENTKYTTVNGIKEFSCKDGYVDNIYLEGETLVNLSSQFEQPSRVDEDNVVRTRFKDCADRFNPIVTNGDYTLINFTDKILSFVGLNPECNSWSFHYMVQPYTKVLVNVTSNQSICGVDYGVSDGWSSTDFSMYKASNHMLLKGDHTNKPMSYFEGLKSVGQGDKIEVLTYQGENLFDGTYDIGYFNSVVGGYIENLVTDVPTKTTKWIACKPNTLYHLIGGNRGSVQIKNNNTIIEYKGDYETQIVTPSECTHFRVYYERVGQFSLPFRIIEGKQDKKQILTTLRSLPNGVKDTIEKRGNKYYKIKRCVECNPREITYFGGKGTYCQIELKISDLPRIANNSISSNLFGNFGNTGGSKDTIFIHPTYEKTIVIQTTNPSITTKELAQTYIENNNLTVVYELATPIIEELPNFNPQTFEGDTTLLINSGVIQTEADFEVTNSMGSEIDVLKGKVSDNDDTLLLKSDKGHYHSCDENMVTLWKGSLKATSGDIALTDSVLNYKALIVNVGNVGGGKNTSLTIYPFNLGSRQEPHGKIRVTEEMYATLFAGTTPYKYYFKPSSTPNNLYFEIRNSSNVVVSSNPDSQLFNIRYIVGVK